MTLEATIRNLEDWPAYLELDASIKAISRVWKDRGSARAEIDRGVELASGYAELCGMPDLPGDVTGRAHDTAIERNGAVYNRIRALELEMSRHGDHTYTADLYKMRSKVELAGYELQIRRIWSRYNGGDYGGPGGCTTKSLPGLTPEDANEMGVALTGLGLYDSAIQFLEDANTGPQGPVAEYNMAVLHNEIGMHHKASLEIEWLLALNRMDKPALFFQNGVALARAADYHKAVSYFDKVIHGMSQNTSIKADSLYYKGYSLYRMGEYSKAIECYDNVPEECRFTDARHMKNQILSIHNSLLDRMWMPLFVVNMRVGLQRMQDIQCAVYLAQLDTGIDEYRFDTVGFGPYSSDLEHDIMTNTMLFECDMRTGQRIRTYRLTKDGRDILERTKHTDHVEAKICLEEYSKTDRMKLLDQAYSSFHPSCDIESIQSDLKNISELAEEQTAAGRHHAYGIISMVSRYAESILYEVDKTSDTGKEITLANISGLIAHTCNNAIRHIGPPVDHFGLDLSLVAVREYGNCLLEVCKEYHVARYEEMEAAA